MSITFVSSAANAATTNNSRLVSEPSGTQEGDLYIALCSIVDETEASTWSTPSGWTKLIENGTGAISANDGVTAVFYRFRGASAAGDTTFTSNATASFIRCTIAAYRGVDGTTPFDVTYNNSNHYITRTNDGNGAAAAITTSTNDAAVVLLQWAITSTVTWTGGAPSGYTIDVSVSNDANKHHHFARKTVATAGAETPGVWTHTGLPGTEDTANYTLALRSASAPATSYVLDTSPLYYGTTLLASKTGIQYMVTQGHGSLNGLEITAGVNGTTDSLGVFQLPTAITDGAASDPVTLHLYWEEGSNPIVDRSLIVKTTLVEDV